ncbi:cation-translocating P-type ATPase [Oxalobacter paraformigenes]|uniref:Calcium-translocating P-type ATPase, PMCA-type n=1 Tax=Oxalobacter paraformigenes TaxID=556268 RepID=C3X6Y8_9BURK|nr:cation-translocating P-type ATPase [Oxalobacter paraformigenes]EEO26901.2 calcium-translocating P-type ATPase, PMCA-type [Oxalobacter paraformigenes]
MTSLQRNHPRNTQKKNLAGLSEKQAQERLHLEGPNELASAKPQSVLAIAWGVVSEPMFLLLISCGFIYLIIGNTEDALILLGSVCIIVAMSFLQERKSERTLETLRDLTSPRALVLRDNVQIRIAGKNIVRDDIVFLSEGDRVPADAVLLDAQNLSVDESLLTGEAVPVRKQIAGENDRFRDSKPGGDDLPFLFSGTLVVQGKGIAKVTATGEKTELGKIGKALSLQEEGNSRVQAETRHAVKVVATASAALVGLLVVWYGITRHDWLHGILAGLTLAMSIMPAEFPLVLTIFLGLGAWRMAQKKVLTRRIPAIEMLGAATVLCVDKTGTLTENRMVLSKIAAGGNTYSFDSPASLDHDNFPEVFHETLEFAMLSSQRDPFDPMETAIQQTGRQVLAGTEHIHDSWSLVEEYPLSRELLAISRVWRSPDLSQYVIAAKGAPEAIVDLCHLDEDATNAISAQVNVLAEQGLRVLAVAKASFQQGELPSQQHDFNFEFLGIVGLADPLRPTVHTAVKECLNAGIRVIMITGDYPATARKIAEEAGLDAAGATLTGQEMETLSHNELKKRVKTGNIFCRATPEQKLQLVKVLKENGEIVAMTGDGVNDAPALKSAHIGIAMGERGTDVARESASLVLLNDDFSSIVSAVRLGRRIFDNIRKAVVFIVAAHIPIAGLSLIPVMLGWPLMLLPIHIVFFELMVDPVCSVAFENEPEETDVMTRPPRPTNARIFDRSILWLGVRQGLALLAWVVFVYWFAQKNGFDSEQARTLTFTAMITGDIWLILINRSWSRSFQNSFKQKNPILWSVLAVTVLVLLAGIFIPSVQALFHFGTVHWEYTLISIGATVCFTGLLSSIRFFRRKS